MAVLSTCSCSLLSETPMLFMVSETTPIKARINNFFCNHQLTILTACEYDGTWMLYQYQPTLYDLYVIVIYCVNSSECLYFDAFCVYFISEINTVLSLTWLHLVTLPQKNKTKQKQWKSDSCSKCYCWYYTYSWCTLNNTCKKKKSWLVLILARSVSGIS